MLLDHFCLHPRRLHRNLLRKRLGHEALLWDRYLLKVGLVLNLGKTLAWCLIGNPSESTPLVVLVTVVRIGIVATPLPSQMITDVSGLDILLCYISSGINDGRLIRCNGLECSVVLRLECCLSYRTLYRIVLGYKGRLRYRTLNNLLLCLHGRFSDGTLDHVVLSLVNGLRDRLLHNELLRLKLCVNDRAHGRHDFLDLRRFVDISRLIDVVDFDYRFVNGVCFVSCRGFHHWPANGVLTRFFAFLDAWTIANDLLLQHAVLVFNPMRRHWHLLHYRFGLEPIPSYWFADLGVNSIANEQYETCARNR